MVALWTGRRGGGDPVLHRFGCANHQRSHRGSAAGQLFDDHSKHRRHDQRLRLPVRKSGGRHVARAGHRGQQCAGTRQPNGLVSIHRNGRRPLLFSPAFPDRAAEHLVAAPGSVRQPGVQPGLHRRWHRRGAGLVVGGGNLHADDRGLHRRRRQRHLCLQCRARRQCSAGGVHRHPDESW